MSDSADVIVKVWEDTVQYKDESLLNCHHNGLRPRGRGLWFVTNISIKKSLAMSTGSWPDQNGKER